MNFQEQVDSYRGIVSDAEVAAFKRDGFALPKQGLPSDATQGLCQAAERVMTQNADWANLLRMPHVPKRDGVMEGVVGGEDIFRYAVHPAVLAVARAVCGPNVIMWGAELFAKPPSVGKATPWHQDIYTPTVRSAKEGGRASGMSIWIAIDRCTPENGCLRFIPESGRSGALQHVRHAKTEALLNFDVDKAAIDESAAVDSIREPGQFSLHDMYVVHGANANTSGRRRAGLAFHYMSAEDVYDRTFGSGVGSGLSVPAPIAKRPIWLVLGENKHPGNDFRIGHDHLEDLDRIAEETRVRLNAAVR